MTPPGYSAADVSARNEYPKCNRLNLRLISAEIAGQEIQMDIIAYSQRKSRHVGAFETPAAIASDVPESRIEPV
jgi:hypothetical protein